MKKSTLYEATFKKVKQDSFDIQTLDVSGFCEKILSYKTKTDKEKIDALLEFDTMFYTELGYGSPKKDKLQTKKSSRIVYRAIKSINESLGKSLLEHMDKDE